MAKDKGIFTCVDPKQNYTKYIGCSLIKPNLQEARRLFDIPPSASLADIHATIREKVGCKISVVTMSEQGMTAHDGQSMICMEPQVCKILDVTGAGDVVHCILAYFLCQGNPLANTLRLATDIGTKSVQFPGTYTLSRRDILGKRVAPSDVANLRSQDGESIVFTNGCFDLLHSGHIQLFKFCRSQGKLVVLGLNSDASIRRLKGPSRPVNSLETRLDILMAIQYIDYIVVFEEDTPYEILQQLRPDCMVKGGDYTGKEVIGAEFAKNVVLFDYIEGVSSSATIQKILGDSLPPSHADSQ
jgi:D-beta-D-heptose 7-phosphate kinase/D-beta-D-heptose 1-phosphate adenosyltransferase